MMRGGRQVTQRISEEMNLTLEQAEDMKRRKGCELGPCQTFVSELAGESMIGKSTPFEQVLLCGGGAAMPGLKSYLSLRLGLEPQTFPLPPPLSPFQHVSAFGAALSERPGQPRVRLHVGVTSSAPGGIDPWIFLGISWALTMGLLIADTETRYNTIRTRQGLARGDLLKTIQHWLPGADRLTPDAMVEKLKQNIQNRKNLRQQSVRFITDTVARMATVLREVPKAEIRKFGYEDNKIRLAGEVSSSQEAEKLREKLARVFPELQTVNVRSGAPGRFNYEFEGRMPSL